jgi:hypothetical protein
VKFPYQLRPQTHEYISLSSRRKARIPKTLTTFQLWAGRPPGKSYGGKAIIKFRGRPMFAELAIRLVFQEAGWKGVWVDSFGAKFRDGFWTDKTVSLPPTPRAVYDRIAKRAGGRGGCWDVLCWNGQQVVFAEAKRSRRDKIRETQKRWLKAAIAEGLTERNFLIVEWSVEAGATRGRQSRGTWRRG